jgi:carbamate kinase
MARRKKKQVAVIALGGNVLTRAHEEGTIEEQEANANRMCGHLMSLISGGYNIVITHGNGPQVGNLLIQNDAARKHVPSLPLDVLVAETEGFMGYILQQEFLNHLRKRNIHSYVVTMITQVMVDKDDPSFKRPTKPVGPFYGREEAERIKKARKWKMVEDSGRGWRRVVPSPKPIKIIQRYMIRDLVRAGNVVIALGGGGIPMTKDDSNNYVGMEAVVDKDRASALLAGEIGADLFVILTPEERVCLNYGKKNQRPLDVVTVKEAKKYMKEGHFPPGSMGPKMESALAYIQAGGPEVLITDPEHLEAALEGKAGTRIVRTKSGTTRSSLSSSKTPDGIYAPEGTSGDNNP